MAQEIPASLTELWSMKKLGLTCNELRKQAYFVHLDSSYLITLLQLR